MEEQGLTPRMSRIFTFCHNVLNSTYYVGARGCIPGDKVTSAEADYSYSNEVQNA
jgi:hypothetical protein